MPARYSSFEAGDRVCCTTLDGGMHGPFTVTFSQGRVTFVRMSGGTVLPLPTYRLRLARPTKVAPKPRRASGARP